MRMCLILLLSLLFSTHFTLCYLISFLSFVVFVLLSSLLSYFLLFYAAALYTFRNRDILSITLSESINFVYIDGGHLSCCNCSLCLLCASPYLVISLPLHLHSFISRYFLSHHTMQNTLDGISPLNVIAPIPLQLFHVGFPS